VDVHPVVERAAQGELPPWAAVSPGRREHMDRVSRLLDAWAREEDLTEVEQVRLRAAGYLHDVLHEAEPEALRGRVPPGLDDLPGELLHGPAAAEQLRCVGVRDGELLRAVAYHTLGHVGFGQLGRLLYVADFLEPGRDLLNDWRASLREKMPDQTTVVLRSVVAARIAHLVDEGRRLRPETVAFWNSLAEEG
jgi:HD superfamily phosphohydrolase YqeK